LRRSRLRPRVVGHLLADYVADKASAEVRRLRSAIEPSARASFPSKWRRRLAFVKSNDGFTGFVKSLPAVLISP
jgi:hypothetical protein